MNVCKKNFRLILLATIVYFFHLGDTMASYSSNIQAIILAAGKSSRFNTEKSKLIYTLCGQEMIVYPVQLLNNLDIPTTLVIGHQKEDIKRIINNYNFSSVSYCEQNQQQGTGHAVLCTQHLWHADHILIMNGDMPLVKKELIKELINKHLESDAAISFVTAHNSDPHTTYGRVVKYNDNVEIIEAKEFKGDRYQHCYINAGIYIIKRSFLEKAVTTLENSSITSEFYITDLVKKASTSKLHVQTVNTDFDNIRGINTLKELWSAEHIKRSEIIEDYMNKGVRFMSPQTTSVDINTSINKGTVVESNVHIINKSSIGKNCIIKSGSIIDNSTLEDNITIEAYTIVQDSMLKNNTQAGPFSHIRKSSILEEEAIIGNFVEVSQSTIGAKTKAKHLSYIGHALVGSKVNMGAGSIICNYNGVAKNKTIIKDKAFIGSNSALIAPVTIGEESIVAAGSTVTDNVPDQALTIARAQQINKLKYAPLLKKRYQEKANR